jgi:alpha-1,6-mannosyltransferase
MLLPLFFKYFKRNRTHGIKDIDFKTLLSYYSLVGAVVIGLFIPFLTPQFINTYSESIGLWFGDFEFNASIYYIAREFGYWISGYNQIALISKILALITILVILGLALFRMNNTIQNLMTSMLFAASCYFFLSTTIHPWYISTLILLCIYSNFKFPLVWSAVIVLSYLAYSNSNFEENLNILALEYIIMYSALIYELFIKKRLPFLQQSNSLKFF